MEKLTPFSALRNSVAALKNLIDKKANEEEITSYVDSKFSESVKTVNGLIPDNEGNVEVEIPESFSGSWNDLQDRPFGEEKVVIEWDGDVTGKVMAFDSQTSKIVKIADVTIPEENLVGTRVVISTSAGESQQSFIEEVTGETGKVAAFAGGFVCYEAGTELSQYGMSIVFPETGVYGVYDSYQGVIAYTRLFENTTVTQLDPKYIPSSVALDEELHTVAKSGSYNDLADVPTDVSVFTNDVGYLTEHQDISAYALKTELPTTLDDLHPATTADTGKIIMVQSDGKWSIQALETEQWTFTLDDGTEVVKNVVVL